MSNLRSTYKFFLTLPQEGVTQVYPCNNTLEWTYEGKEELGFKRKTLGTELKFGNETHNTFDALYFLEKQKNTCYKVDLEIQKLVNGAFQTEWNGYLPFRKGQWDLSRMVATLKPRVEDGYTCILENYKVVRNLLEVEPRITIASLIGDVECTDLIYLQDTEDGSLEHALELANQLQPSGDAWTVSRLEIDRVGATFDDPDNYYTVYAKYCREKLTTTPTDTTGWTQDGANWYRSLPIDVSKWERSTSGVRTVYEWTYVDFEIDNAIRLKDALDLLFDDCGHTIVSDFYNINPDSTAPSNYAYEKAALYNQNIALSQSSDVIRPDADTNARLMETSIEKFVIDLFKRHNVELWVDGSTLRIEHKTYRTNQRMLDLTQSTHLGQLKGKAVYSYDDNEFPRVQTFKDAIETNNQDFNNASFEYDQVCSHDGTDITDEDETLMNKIVTDVTSLYNNQSYVDDDDALFSITMYSLDANNAIIQANGDLTGNLVLNAPQSWANCIAYYHQNDRPLSSGKMNGRDVMFLDVKPQRKQESLQVGFSAEDWDTFDPYHLVKTQFGWGYVEDVKYTDPYGKLELELSFK